MAEQLSQITRHGLEAKIVKRCWEDEAFRREFTTDSKGSFTKYLDIPAESLPRIVVHEEEPGTWHIVLPQMPVRTAELSREELERVSGGSYFVTATVIIATVSAAASATSVSISASMTITTDNGW
jgi:hypothetical protein